jgi:hypothetical protein
MVPAYDNLDNNLASLNKVLKTVVAEHDSGHAGAE